MASFDDRHKNTPSAAPHKPEPAPSPQAAQAGLDGALNAKPERKGALTPEAARIMASEPVLSRPEALGLLKQVASLQATTYQDQLARFDAYDARRGSVLGTLRNVLSYLANPQVGVMPSLLVTAYARGDQLKLQALFPQLSHKESIRSFSDLLDDILKSPLVDPVFSPAGRGGQIVVGIRITSQELFDAVK